MKEYYDKYLVKTLSVYAMNTLLEVQSDPNCKWEFSGVISSEDKEISFKLENMWPEMVEIEYNMFGKFSLVKNRCIKLGIDFCNCLNGDRITYTFQSEEDISFLYQIVDTILQQSEGYKTFMKCAMEFVNKAKALVKIENLLSVADLKQIDENQFEFSTPEYNFHFDEDWNPEWLYCEVITITSKDSNAFKQVIYNQETSRVLSLPEEKEKSVIHVDDVIIRTNNSVCTNREHQLIKYDGMICIDDGITIKEVKAFILYCQDCDKYYMSESEFNRLTQMGRICAQVITIDEYKAMSQQSAYDWAEQSLLRSYGYNVSAKEGLSSRERQRILSFMIENDIISVSRAIDFINWLMYKKTGRNLDKAREKWQEDIIYLQDYEPAEGIIKVDKMYKKNRIVD